jgi:hypothetical protein
MPAGATGELQTAGFSNDEIAAWATKQRQELTGAGFSNDEIDNFLGGPKPTMPPAFLDRIARATDINTVIGATLKGAKEGFGTPQAMSPETEQFWRDIGIFNDPQKGQASPIRSFNESIIRPLGAAVNVVGAAINAGVTGIGAGVEQAAEQTGVPQPQRLGEETVNFLNFLGAQAMSGTPFMRPSRGPMGEIHELPIGGLPERGDFADAGKATVGTINPEIEAKIRALWDVNGIHPAEVAHDAHSDVTITQDLASTGETPPKHYVDPVEPAPAPEVHDLARQLEPELFENWQNLTERGNALRTQLDQLQTLQRQRTTPEITDLDRQINEKRAERLEAPRADQAGLANDVIALERQRTALVDQLPPVGTDTPAMAAARKELQDIDYQRRDIAPDVSATYRRAEAEMPPPPTAEPDASFTMEAPTEPPAAAAAAPTEPAAMSLEEQSALINDQIGRLKDRLDETTNEGEKETLRNEIALQQANVERIEERIKKEAEPAITTSGEVAPEGQTAPVPADKEEPDPFASKEAGAIRNPFARQPPRSTTPEGQAMLDRLSIGESDRGRPWTWSRIYSVTIDRLHALSTTTNFLRGQSVLSAGENPYTLARLYAGVSGKANQWLNHATYDFDTYANTGKSLREILAPVNDDLNGFREYASALRALELESQGIKTGFDLGAARTVAAAGHVQYAPIMADIVEYQNKLIAYLRDSGVISDASYNAMTSQHLLYVPFQRVFGDAAGDLIPQTMKGTGTTLQASDPIHHIVGSERRVIDPLESMIRNTYLSIMMAERNAVGTKLIDLINRAGGMPVPGRADTISIFRNGVKETHRVDEALAAAIKGLDEEAANSLIRLLGVPARVLRAGATLSPDFMLRNPIRDFFTAMINTTKGVFSPIDTAKGLLSAIHKDADFQEWLKGGGANAALVSLDRRYLQQNLADLTKETGLMTRAWNVVRHPIDSLRAFSELSEQATRLGEFKSAREQALAAGATPKEAAQTAAFASRESTVDFARRGSAMRSANMITAFFNANLQGVDRLGRAFHDNPTGTSLRIAAGITLPSIALWALNHDNPDYQELPAWQRDLFWIVPVGSAPPSPLHIAQAQQRGVAPTPSARFFMRIPKPFEPGVTFGSGVERLLDAYYDGKPDAFNGFASSVIGALLPGIIPTFALPSVEQFANRSSFTDRTLIPADVEKQLPEYRYQPYTTETAKKLGSLIAAFPGIRELGVSNEPGSGVARALQTPILQENYLRAWTGGLGNYALQVVDAGLRKAGVVPDPPKPEDTLADIPFVKAFVVRYPSAGTESIQGFYDEYESNKQFYDTWQAKAQEGDATAMLRIQNVGGPRMFLQFDSMKQALGEQAKLVRDIWKDPSMDPHEKRQLIDQIYFNEIQIAKAGLTAMRSAEAQLNAPTARPNLSDFAHENRPRH